MIHIFYGCTQLFLAGRRHSEMEWVRPNLLCHSGTLKDLLIVLKKSSCFTWLFSPQTSKAEGKYSNSEDWLLFFLHGPLRLTSSNRIIKELCSPWGTCGEISVGFISPATRNLQRLSSKLRRVRAGHSSSIHFLQFLPDWFHESKDSAEFYRKESLFFFPLKNTEKNIVLSPNSSSPQRRLFPSQE